LSGIHCLPILLFNITHNVAITFQLYHVVDFVHNVIMKLSANVLVLASKKMANIFYVKYKNE